MNLALLEALTQIHGVSGDESEICSTLKKEASAYVDELWVDAMGNLFAHRKGNGPKRMLCAHMDTVGFLVTHFEPEGLLRVAPLGGIDPTVALQAPVRFKNGVQGVLSCDEDKLGKELKIQDLFLDVGACDRTQAQKMVALGDTAAYRASFLCNGETVISPYLDNRAGCFLLLDTMRRVNRGNADLTFVFSVQEEVGTRGVAPAAYSVAPEEALVIDVTCPDDLPGALHEGTTSLGKGAAVKVMDRSLIVPPHLVERLLNLGTTLQIPVQRDIMTGGGTDGGAIHRSRDGVRTGGISIPCRYTHSPTELLRLEDLEAAIRLTVAFCESE